MIRLVRTYPEPEQLSRERERELPRARDAMARGGVDAHGKPFKFSGYDAGKGRLFADQHAKCAFCEKREEQAKYRDVEHYRPKNRYWWLAWSWDNLLFACFECNRDHKRDQFPLVDDTTRLEAEAVPPGREQPLLLDPYDPVVDPGQHIVFRREKVHGKERWKPYGRTTRGTDTIRICGLDRPALLSRYGDHVRDLVRPKVALFDNVRKTENTQEVFAAWSRLRRSLLAPGQEFQSLSRDAVRALVSVEVRQRYSLDL